MQIGIHPSACGIWHTSICMPMESTRLHTYAVNTSSYLWTQHVCMPMESTRTWVSLDRHLDHPYNPLHLCANRAEYLDLWCRVVGGRETCMPLWRQRDMHVRVEAARHACLLWQCSTPFVAMLQKLIPYSVHVGRSSVRVRR